MLTQEENDLLTRVGPGTPCGELMRRYWQPAALAEELPPSGPPVPVRLLGEDLVLFRDEEGRPGLLDIHCSHRGADLSYGRIEDGGLRCLYHGWLYDVNGRCLEQPSEPAGSSFHEKVGHLAYPCRDVGGLILAYLGPGEPPLVPAYEFLHAPEENRLTTKVHMDCNYLQGNEGNIDPAHPYYLHRLSRDDSSYTASDAHPIIEVEETDFGTRQFTMFRFSEEEVHFKVNNFVLPNFTTVGGGGRGNGYEANWHVPIDDTQHWKYMCRFHRDTPYDREAFYKARAAEVQNYHLVRNSANRYMQDRESMKKGPFTGMGIIFNVHDGFATGSPGPIQDRTREQSGYTDKSIIAARKVLLRAIRDVQEGQEPLGVVRDPAKNDFSHMVLRRDQIPASADWREHWKRVFQEAQAENRASTSMT